MQVIQECILRLVKLEQNDVPELVLDEIQIVETPAPISPLLDKGFT